LKETSNTNDTIKTFKDLSESTFCMMYFVRGCRNERHARGLCNKHYHMVRKCVITGALTWERVEKQCKALPLKPKEERKNFIKDMGGME